MKKLKNGNKISICDKRYFSEKNKSICFIDFLSDVVKENTSIIVDIIVYCGLCKDLNLKNQILLHDFNNTAMGWSIPAAIATALATKEVIAIIGDGHYLLCYKNYH